MPRRVVAGCAAAIAAALLLAGVPWATQERRALDSTPTPRPFNAVAPLLLGPGAKACQTDVALETSTTTALVLSSGFEGTGPPLRVTVSTPGYRARGEARGYGPFEEVGLSFPAPPRSLLATVCVENRGRRSVPLQASTESRLAPRSPTVVDGRAVPQYLALLMAQSRDRSVADRPGELLDRVAAFKPWWIGRASLALLVVLLLAGVPLLVLRALWTSADDGR